MSFSLKTKAHGEAEFYRVLSSFLEMILSDCSSEADSSFRRAYNLADLLNQFTH